MGKKRKEGKSVTPLSTFIQKNKSKIRRFTEGNSNRNQNGLESVSKDDPWFNESDWDDSSKETGK